MSEKVLDAHYSEERIIKATETEDDFMFEFMSKYLDGAIVRKDGFLHIPKLLLIRALDCFKEEHAEEWNYIMKGENNER